MTNSTFTIEGIFKGLKAFITKLLITFWICVFKPRKLLMKIRYNSLVGILPSFSFLFTTVIIFLVVLSVFDRHTFSPFTEEGMAYYNDIKLLFSSLNLFEEIIVITPIIISFEVIHYIIGWLMSMEFTLENKIKFNIHQVSFFIKIVRYVTGSIITIISAMLFSIVLIDMFDGTTFGYFSSLVAGFILLFLMTFFIMFVAAVFSERLLSLAKKIWLTVYPILFLIITIKVASIILSGFLYYKENLSLSKVHFSSILYTDQLIFKGLKFMKDRSVSESLCLGSDSSYLQNCKCDSLVFFHSNVLLTNNSPNNFIVDKNDEPFELMFNPYNDPNNYDSIQLRICFRDKRAVNAEDIIILLPKMSIVLPMYCVTKQKTLRKLVRSDNQKVYLMEGHLYPHYSDYSHNIHQKTLIEFDSTFKNFK